MVSKVMSVPEIYCIDMPLPDNPLKNLNCYVLCSNGENLLIDTGFRRPECEAALWAGIEELKLDLTKTSVFLTHLHGDHTGLAPLLAEKGCKIYMSGIDYDFLRETMEGRVWPYMETLFAGEGFPPQEIALQASGNHARLYGPKKLFPVERVTDGAQLCMGALTLQCIHVPGHTPGQTVLYLPEEQILFSADHVLFDITPNIGLWRGVENSLKDYLVSLNKLKKFPIRITLPAHRTYHKSVYERIAEIEEHHNKRLEEIYDAVEKHPGASAYKIASLIHWSSRGKVWTEFPPNQKWFATSETLSHLRYLAIEGRVRREEKSGVSAYYIMRE